VYDRRKCEQEGKIPQKCRSHARVWRSDIEATWCGDRLSDDPPDRAIVPHFPFGMHENINVTSLTFSNLSAQRGTRLDH
jgi:hypothetical protein